MIFDINRVNKNKMRSRETRPRSSLLKRVFADLESRILDLPEKWDYALIEGCRRSDLKELSKNKDYDCYSYNDSDGKQFGSCFCLYVHVAASGLGPIGL